MVYNKIQMTKSEVNYKNLLSERERDLEDRNEELEAQHEELTAAIEAMIKKNDYLEKTLEELHLRNREIDHIVYRSYHDLKTPITALEGLLKLIETDPDYKELYLEKSKLSISDMKHRLKLLARYSSSLVEEVSVEPIDMSGIWEEVLNDLEHTEGFNEMRITFTRSCMGIYSDKERIKLLLYNTVKNAIDFRSVNGRIDLSIQIRGNMLKIQVVDNGCGINEEIQPRVFDMFFRGGSTSKGSGLGLYLCKRTVDILGGKIGLVSSVGTGTTVTIEIPIKKAEDM
jgi:signal transduction histidine kinase